MKVTEQSDMVTVKINSYNIFSLFIEEKFQRAWDKY